MVIVSLVVYAFAIYGFIHFIKELKKKIKEKINEKAS